MATLVIGRQHLCSNKTAANSQWDTSAHQTTRVTELIRLPAWPVTASVHHSCWFSITFKAGDLST